MGDHMQEKKKPDIRCPYCGSLARYDENVDQEAYEKGISGVRAWLCRKVPAHIFYLENSGE